MTSGPQTKKDLGGTGDFLNLLVNHNHINIKSLRSQLKSLSDIESPSKT